MYMQLMYTHLHSQLLQLPVHRDREDIAEVLPETSPDPYQPKKVQQHSTAHCTGADCYMICVGRTVIAIVVTKYFVKTTMLLLQWSVMDQTRSVVYQPHCTVVLAVSKTGCMHDQLSIVNLVPAGSGKGHEAN